MGYRPRIDAAGAWHHVMNRGSGRRVVFRDDVDRSIFLESLGEVDGRFGVEVHVYCLMGNHFHVLVRSLEGRLSDAMQWLSSGFTRRVNSRRGVDGALFRSRFHSVAVAHGGHARYLVGYIHANPRDLGWDQPLDRYPWSSLGQYVGIVEPTDWLVQRTVLGWFDDDRHRLGKFVEEAGSELADIARVQVGQPQGGLDAVLDAVELARSLVQPTPRADAARLGAILVAQDRISLAAEQAATHFGLKPSSFRSALSRARHRNSTDGAFARMVTIALGLIHADVALRV